MRTRVRVKGWAEVRVEGWAEVRVGLGLGVVLLGSRGYDYTCSSWSCQVRSVTVQAAAAFITIVLSVMIVDDNLVGLQIICMGMLTTAFTAATLAPELLPLRELLLLCHGMLFAITSENMLQAERPC